jgi:hypothetical protein
LALPVTVLLIIVGFSFWSEAEGRVDITLQMLLVVSALYLVVGQVIPFVGYFTLMDTFITTSFLLLSVTTGIHFINLVIISKADNYPMGFFLKDCIDYLFRLIWIPMSAFLFVIFFDVFMSEVIVMFIIVCIISGINSIYGIPRLLISFKESVLKLREKHLNFQKSECNPEKNTLLSLTRVEKFILIITKKYYNISESCTEELSSGVRNTHADDEFGEKPVEDNSLLGLEHTVEHLVKYQSNPKVTNCLILLSYLFIYKFTFQYFKPAKKKENPYKDLERPTKNSG